MKEIIIIGAGGHAKVVIDSIEEINKRKNEFRILGLLDDNAGGEILGYKIIGSFADVEKFDDNIFFHIAICNNELRENIYNTNKDRKFLTIVYLAL